ncbi:LamG-like jellyroll fold domain-containing protein [Flavobacterium sp.]|uniref:LamG-like jellyroll fold domain-containing protein n=1 Tax=Flavobacterium sp. TaxID=239 RepID=UPI0037A2F7A6
MKKNKYIFLVASVIASQFFGSCNGDSIDKVNAPIAYEKIGGYNTSDDVAASNLISKLSFENNLTDSKGAITAAVPTNVGYAAGKKGMAYSGSSSQERYAVANASSAITGLNNFTFSFWINTANTVDPATAGQGKGAQGIFSIVRPTEFWGGMNLFLENPDSAHPDRVRLKLDVQNGRAGVAWGGQDVMINLDNVLNTWIHIVISYNSATSMVTCYTNGALSANISGFAYAPSAGLVGTAPWFADNPGSIANINNAPKYGIFQMVGTNGKVVLGTHQFDTTPPQNNGSQQGWATSFVGLLDEFRIYNAALTTNEVSALYKLEKDNR